MSLNNNYVNLRILEIMSISISVLELDVNSKITREMGKSFRDFAFLAKKFVPIDKIIFNF